MSTLRKSVLWGSALAVALSGAALAQTQVNLMNSIPTAGSRGGALPYHYISAASTNPVVIKASFGTVYSVHLVNPNPWPIAYLHLYDKSTAPTCGTDVPVQTYAIQQGDAREVTPAVGITFANGISFCITGGSSDTDATAAPAGVTLNITYK